MLDKTITIPTDYPDWKQRTREAIQHHLAFILNRYPETEVRHIAEYATLGPGHRWRPLVSCAAGMIFSEDAIAKVLPPACGIEMAHAASLVLDDLPSMDDADIRRGKACPHKVFSSWAVDMAPIFLLNTAYDVSLSNEKASEASRIATALVVANAGTQMISGQVEDMEQNEATDAKARLISLYKQKAGHLYAAAGKIGALTCNASDKDAKNIFDACMALGLAYQFMDDVADVTADEATVGKSVGKDANKTTTIDLFGVDGTIALAEDYQNKALAYLECFDAKADYLRALVSEASWKAY